MWGKTEEVAVTYIQYYVNSGRIIDCDLVFNDGLSWSTSNNPSSYRYDVESIALHELGHFLSLCDLYGDLSDGVYDTGKVMYGYGNPGTKKRSLHADDIAGIQWIYPPYVDIGLRMYDGTSVIKIACEPQGTLSSPLRIAKHGKIYGIVLVDPSDPKASSMRIKTKSGVPAKAIREF